MRAVLVLAVLTLAVSGSGCIEGLETQFSKLRGDEPVPENFELTAEEVVGPGYARSFPVPVETGALQLAVTAHLVMAYEDNEAPFVPAQLVVSILDPSGSAVEQRTLDPGNPEASLEVGSFPSFGQWRVTVEGHGLGGNGMGAAYNLTALVTY